MYEILRNLLFKFEPETAHRIAEFSLRGTNFMQNFMNYSTQNEILEQNLLGLKFKNPIGLAGGFDKNATMINPLAKLGFGFLEFGTFTPKSQPGNPKPRLFRLKEEESLQNAMGFNNDGAAPIKRRIKKIYPFKIPLIANVGKNKITPNDKAIEDYLFLAREFSELCDAFLINVSSPNTPNLRDLQEVNFIETLICEILKVTNRPIFFKIAPDMSDAQAILLCQTAVDAGAKGIVVNNTSVDYSLSANSRDFGGISGKLICEKSRKLFAAVAKELHKKAVLVSCGGICDANEAYRRIRLGANLVEIFTAFIYVGPQICLNFNKNLEKLLQNDGFKSISEAIGVDL